MANNFDMYYNKSVLSEFSYSSRNLFRDSMNSKGKVKENVNGGMRKY